MRRRTALFVAVALSGALVLPSAAAPLFSGPTDPVGERVELAPSSDYASLDDGELVVDLSGDAAGVNSDAVTAFDDVFAVRYSGAQRADVWLTHESEDVTFFARGEPVQSAANSVALGPDDSVAVGIRVDTTGKVDETLLDDVTVHSRVAESDSDDDSTDGDVGSNVRSVATADSRQFTVLDASAGEPVALNTSGLALAGDDATLEELAVTRATDGPLSVAVERVDASAAGPLPDGDRAEALGGVQVTTGSSPDDIQGATFRFGVSAARLDAVDAEADELTLYRHSDGEWTELEARVVGERDGRVVVAAETPGFSTFVLAAQRPAVDVESATLDQATVSADEPVTVTADVVNAGGAAGERTVALTLDGDVVAERTVALGAGESETVRFEVTPTPGEYDVGVEGTDAGSLVVEAETDAGTTAGGESADGSDAGATDEADATPVAEPAGIDLPAVAGVSVMLALVVATLALARRVPRE